MKPYVRKNLGDHITVFDYRSSQIHCVAFEILVHKFCLFTSKILVTLEKVNCYQTGSYTTVVHNMLCQKSRKTYTPEASLDSENKNLIDFIPSLSKTKNNHLVEVQR